ncbi:MAG: TonB-dependent receptor [Asticcacaulis sp.]|uniref:TonB-dependent receptor n=1 Tax=Asticcacaulis sp. TaxID=1872648 RepID=UPI0039E42768
MRQTAPLVLAMALAALLPSLSHAEDAGADSGTSETGTTIVVKGSRASMMGTKNSSSAGTITSTQVSEYPVLRPGEVLQLVPGVVVVAHAAAGKANQYYLRGFQLDHGDMFLSEVDGVPVNMVTHAHGPGYNDLNWLIPEAIGGIDYTKGPYYADKGDFDNAGSADIKIADIMPGEIKLEAGGDGYARALLMNTFKAGKGNLAGAFEYMHDDGPWTVKNNYRRYSGILRYSQGDSAQGYSITLQGYSGIWNGGDQVPLRGIEDGSYDRYEVLDPYTGGSSTRYSLFGNWHKTDVHGRTDIEVYAVNYSMDLFSNFTYYMDPNGDEQRQQDFRWIYGGKYEREIDGAYLGQNTRDRFGVQLRYDSINLQLDHTIERQAYYHVLTDQVHEIMLSPWWENTIEWDDRLTSTFGVRLDNLAFQVNSDTTANSGKGDQSVVSPKFGLRYRLDGKTDLFFQSGYGISSQDVRGVVNTVTPGPVEHGGGDPTSRTLAIYQNKGGEIGLHSRAIPHLDSSVSLWFLASENEFAFDGDSGAVVGSGRPGQRWGFEWNNRWQPVNWLDITGDIALSTARYTDKGNEAGDQIPESVRFMTNGEATLHDLKGLPGTSFTLGWRYIGPRYLIEDGSVMASAATTFNLRAEKALTPNLSVTLAVLNLADAKYYDAEYYYGSCLKGEDCTATDGEGYADHMVHPGEPREFRVSIQRTF